MTHSIINISTLASAFGRMDADYFRPDFLEVDEILKKVGFQKLNRYLTKIDVGHVGSMTKEYRDHGVLLLQTQNVSEFFVKLDNEVYITEEFHDKLKKSQIRKGDILIARSGSFGKACIYYEDEVINSADIIIVNVDSSKINPEFLVSFLNSRYGSKQLVRFASGGVQGHVNLTILAHLKVPDIEAELQLAISELVKEAYQKQKRSRDLYSKATNLLEDALELKAIEYKTDKSYVSSFSSVVASQRLDSNHFKPKFDHLLNHIISNFDYIHLGTSVVLNRRGVQPIYDNNGSRRVVTSKHITATHIDYDNLERTTEHHYISNPQAHIIDGDILTYTTGAYVGQTNVYLDNEPALASNHVNILRLKSADVDSTYIAFVMNSIVGKTQTEKHIRGSAQAELYPNDMAKYIIPIVDKDIMASISKNVKDSLEALRKSKELLEQAIHEVEALIEKTTQLA